MHMYIYSETLQIPLRNCKNSKIVAYFFFWWVQYLDDPPHLVMIPNMIHLFLANYWTILYHIIIP